MNAVRFIFFRLLLSIILLATISSASIADEAVFRKVLENGLVVLTKESAEREVVSIYIAVRSGITSEGRYTASGISHLVEHMVFKGTSTRKPGDIEKEVRAFGGIINGAVSPDITTYQLTLPSAYLEKALSILNDMLANAAFDKAELEKEREVIIKELKMNEDDPERVLTLSLFNNAYLRHPYKYPLIGYESLLRTLTRDDLLNYYRATYAPNRMVVSVVGGIERTDAAAKVEAAFGNMRRADYAPIYRHDEPLQIGMRGIETEAPITLSYLALGFHSTGILDKDLFALDVLSMMAGRGDNSLFNKSLVKDGATAYSVTAWNWTPQEPGLFVISAILPKENIERAQKLIIDEFKKLKDGLVGDKELETAKNMVLADYILSRETTEGQARDLAENEMMTGNHDFSRRYVEGIGKVTKGDIRRAAMRYLTEDNLTAATLVPKGAGSLAVRIEKPSASDRIEKRELPNGMRVLARANTNIPVVSISVAFSGGLLAEAPDNNGISNLTAAMLLKGTKTRREDEITGAIENLGGTIASFSGLNSFGINITVLKKDADFALELLKDVLTNPSFPADELGIEKTITIAAIKDEEDDIFQNGFAMLRKILFMNHPYGMRPLGEVSTVSKLKAGDLVNFYEKHCIPNNTVLSVSGDIEPAKIFKKIDSLFKDAKAKEAPKFQIREVSIDSVRSRTLEMDREQALVILGFKTAAVRDPDRFALDILESVLSGSSGRLFSALRDKAALAYTLGAAQKRGADTGYMVFYAATTKDKARQAQKLLLEQLRLVKEIPVTDDELSGAKREIILYHRTMRETNTYCALQSCLDELYGLGYDDIYKYEEDIEKVTKEDLKRVANKYLDLKAYAEVMVIPE